MKFFGTSVVATGTVSLSQKTHTFTIVFPTHRRIQPGMSSLSQLKTIGIKTQYMFLLISRVGYSSNVISIGELLTTSGEYTGFSCLKVSVFLSVFLPSDILSGTCGRLGNEKIVGKFIQGRPCFWCLVESPPPQPAGGPVAIPQDHVWKQLQDWREAIHILLTSEARDIKIRIAEHNT